jgi:hypothetical protein
MADDGTRQARSLADWLDGLHFADLPEDRATERVIGAVVAWAEDRGWRVYRRAPSVVPLPSPLKGQSVLDVACARPGGQPIAIEVDRLDRQRTVDKLLAEAAAGRLAIWVRWGTGPFRSPPLPVHLVTREAVRTRGTWRTVADRPPPEHSHPVGTASQPSLIDAEPPRTAPEGDTRRD